MTIKRVAGHVLATGHATEDEARALAAYTLADADPARVTKGTETMTNDKLKADDVPVELAKEVVEKDRAASADGVVQAKTDAGSQIRMEPNPTDKSVLTYDGSDPQIDKPAKAEKSPYKSGQPVHDRS